MKLLKYAGLGLAALIVAVLAAGFLLPKTAHVERSIVIEAPPATVFTVLNGFRQFNRWSPWADKDPQARYSLTGPETGVGARMSWTGNDDVGSGAQEILESVPYQLIRVQLEFSGFEDAENIAAYTLVPEGAGTRLTWSFDADNSRTLMGRWFGLFMDGMLGPDYEAGLARLKAFAESLPKADFSGLPMSIVEVAPLAVAMVSTVSARDDRAIGVALGVAYGKISGFINLRGLEQAAPPLAIYQPPEDGRVRFEAAIPVDRTDVAPAGDVRLGQTFRGLAVKAVYQGPYAGLIAANDQITAFLAASGYDKAGPSMEQYISDPASTAETELVTHIYYPVR